MSDEEINENPIEEPQVEESQVEEPVLDDSLSGQPAQFDVLEDESTLSDTAKQNLDLIYDINVEVTVELGRTSMLIKDVLELSPGSVLELNKLAGETVDIFVNHSLIAKGEVVVINENFGVRITEIIGAAARIQNLGKGNSE